MTESKPGILCVANWPSDVGYAWWLMESYWSVIAHTYADKYQTFLAFPEINEIPEIVKSSPIVAVKYRFEVNGFDDIKRNCALVKSNNIKVLYLSDYPVSALAYFCYRLAGVKTIITHDHTPGSRTVATGIRKSVKTLIANMPGFSVDAAFGATRFVAKRLHETNCLRKSKCFPVQNGIRLDTQTTITERPDWLPSDNHFFVITAARANKYKGILFAIDVIAELVKRGHNSLRYVFCGDGPHLNEFMAYAEELCVAQQCIFTGRVNNVANSFSFCHLGFQPSQGEVGYSLSIIEYMLAELPVIVPDNPSVCAATKHAKTGRVYSESSTSDAADQIEWYIQNPKERLRHAEAAKQAVLTEYTLEKTHQALRDALEKTINLQGR